MLKIKVCGMADAQSIAEMGTFEPDYLGFIFYKGTPRFAGQLDEVALKNLSATIKKAGVFVNAGLEEITAAIRKYQLNAVQLHGSEDPAFAATLKERTGIEIIKAFGLMEGFDFKQLNEFEAAVDYFLFDTKTTLHGGSGKAFDWRLLNNYKLTKPFLLSGGIAPESVEAIKQLKHPLFFGVDINSRFEIAPGKKDAEKVNTFIKALRA